MPHYFHFSPNKNTFPGYGKFNPKYGLVSTVRGTRSSNQITPIGQASLRLLSEYTDPSEMYFTNLIKEPHPFKKKPYVKLIRQYLPSLMEELETVFVQPDNETPARILVLGSAVAKHLCPGFKDLNGDHGSFFYNPSLQSYVIPTYHFGSVAQSPRMQEWMRRDLERMFTLPDPVKPKYRLLGPGNHWIIDQDNTNLFLDIETVGTTDEKDSALNVETAKIISIGFKSPGSGEVQILENPTQENLYDLHNLIVHHGLTLVGHNLQFDLAMLSWREGKLWDDVKVIDTMLMAYVLGHTNKSLKHLSTFLTDRPGSRSFGGVEDNEYLAEDVYATEALYNNLYPKVKDTYAYKILNSLVPKFVGMRQAGLKVDRKLFDQILPDLENQQIISLDKLQKSYASGQEINWNSPVQVAPVLVREGVPLTKRTEGGQLTVAAPILAALREDHTVVDDLLSYREQEKVLGFMRSYTGFMQYDGYLHPELVLDGAETGRLSCRKPNLQQVPKIGLIKTIFRSKYDGGKLGLVDLAQAELRIAALISNDENLVEALLSQDVHQYIASLVYVTDISRVTKEQRTNAKVIVFGLMYGGSVKGLSQRLGVPEQEVAHVVQVFFSKFPDLRAWFEYQKMLSVDKGYSETPFGRIRDYRDALVFEGVSRVERMASNSPIQGTASDTLLIILDKFYELCSYHDKQSRPIMVVHDSILIDIHPNEIDSVVTLVSESFGAVQNSPLGEMELFGRLPIVGELVIGTTWAGVEDSSEFYAPDRVFEVSSNAPLKEIMIDDGEVETEILEALSDL